jgi:hypothetical protein
MIAIACALRIGSMSALSSLDTDYGSAHMVSKESSFS